MNKRKVLYGSKLENKGWLQGFFTVGNNECGMYIVALVEGLDGGISEWDAINLKFCDWKEERIINSIIEEKLKIIKIEKISYIEKINCIVQGFFNYKNIEFPKYSNDLTLKNLNNIAEDRLSKMRGLMNNTTLSYNGVYDDVFIIYSIKKWILIGQYDFRTDFTCIHRVFLKDSPTHFVININNDEMDTFSTVEIINPFEPQPMLAIKEISRGDLIKRLDESDEYSKLFKDVLENVTTN